VILLDTHVWVRWLDPQQKPLALNLVDVIETADQVAVSAITCWEVAWLTRRGRLQLKLDLQDWLDNALQGSDDGLATKVFHHASFFFLIHLLIT